MGIPARQLLSTHLPRSMISPRGVSGNSQTAASYPLTPRPPASEHPALRDRVPSRPPAPRAKAKWKSEWFGEHPTSESGPVFCFPLCWGAPRLKGSPSKVGGLESWAHHDQGSPTHPGRGSTEAPARGHTAPKKVSELRAWGWPGRRAGPSLPRDRGAATEAGGREAGGREAGRREAGGRLVGGGGTPCAQETRAWRPHEEAAQR